MADDPCFVTPTLSCHAPGNASWIRPAVFIFDTVPLAPPVTTVLEIGSKVLKYPLQGLVYHC